MTIKVQFGFSTSGNILFALPQNNKFVLGLLATNFASFTWRIGYSGVGTNKITAMENIDSYNEAIAIGTLNNTGSGLTELFIIRFKTIDGTIVRSYS